MAALLIVPLLSAQQSSPARPRLVVVIVVDQMRADYVTRFRGEWHGGLRRLVDRGAWFRNAAYPYSGTETCPGHATISTGVFPAAHGIISNTWWDRATEKTVTCTQDAAVQDIGVSRKASPGDSPAQLMAPGFAERLRAAQPDSRVVTMSLKARSAIMLAGHHADLALWQDEVAGDWLTSSAYASELPAFARDFFAQHPLSADAAKVWELTSGGNDKVGQLTAGENPPAGWTAGFPHPLAGDGSTDRAFLGRWRASPFADTYLEELAVAAIHSMNLGRGPATDFLGIAFSASDYIGHAFGPDSREVEDEYLRLDRTIGNLLDELDRTVGAGNYVVALTADHGVAPVPEQSPVNRGGRVVGSGIVARAEQVLDQRLGPGHHVLQMVDQTIYLEPGVIDRIHSDSKLWHDLQAAILAEPGVQSVFQSAELVNYSGADATTRASALDEFPGRSGDLTISLKPYWILAGGGTTHGTANDYDQHVPIVLFGAGIKPGPYKTKSSPADIAPTLSALCGVPSARTQGRVLSEALRAPVAGAARR
jgi:hypothetical protein